MSSHSAQSNLMKIVEPFGMIVDLISSVNYCRHFYLFINIFSLDMSIELFANEPRTRCNDQLYIGSFMLEMTLLSPISWQKKYTCQWNDSDMNIIIWLMVPFCGMSKLATWKWRKCHSYYRINSLSSETDLSIWRLLLFLLGILAQFGW